MATAGTILSNVRNKFGDTARDLITDTIGLTWLDQATDELCEILMPIRRLAGNAVSADQDSFSVPTDNIVVEVAYHARGLRQPLQMKTAQEFFQLKQSVDGAVGDPRYWTEFESRIYIWPRYASASKTTTISGNATLSTTGTTIVVATAGQLTTSGIIRIDSEDISYSAKGSSGTLANVVRGYSGTTGAQHTSNAAITQLDFQILYRRRPASLSATTDSPDIPSFLHKKLENYVLYLAYMAEGSVEKANLHYNLWKKDVSDAEYATGKEEISHPMRIKNRL